MIWLFWAVLWQAAHLAIQNDVIFVGPFDMLGALWQLLPEVSFWQTLLHSFFKISAGFLMAFVLGILLGWASYACSFVKDLLEPPMLLIRSVPVASFVILALVWIKGENLSTFIAFLMVLPVIWQSVHTGLGSADPELLEMARVYRFSRGKKLRYLYLPAALPYLISAMRVGLGFSWKSGIAGEVIAIPSQAIGTQLYNAKIYLDMPGLFAWTIVIILLSAAIERVVLFLLPDPKGGDLDA